jgi:hypothetical protein
MSRLAVAALALAAARGASALAPTLVLSSSPALGGAAGAGEAPGGVSYESLSQAELAAGLLRVAGAAPAQQPGWEARHWAAGEDAPQLLAVLLSAADVGAARQARAPRRASRSPRARSARCRPLAAPDGPARFVGLRAQELREALAGASASLALPNAAPAEPAGLAAALAAQLAAAKAAGGSTGTLLLSDSCQQVCAPPRRAQPAARRGAGAAALPAPPCAGIAFAAAARRARAAHAARACAALVFFARRAWRVRARAPGVSTRVC